MELLNDIPNNLSATFEKHILHFKQPAGTSRGVLTEKKLWLIALSDGKATGIGECSIIPGLSPDYENDDQYEVMLEKVCSDPGKFLSYPSSLSEYPSVLFGLESAYLDLKNGGDQVLFDNNFTRGEASIPINGLIWMGTEESMLSQIEQKLDQGFSCIKMKVGALDFEKEITLLKSIRDRFSAGEITLRVDANGAFTPENALQKLERLAELDIHSIEQPIRAGQIDQMTQLCLQTPLPVALDEELIGITDPESKRSLLKTIRPQYIILKPSLHGGFSGTVEWINIADSLNIPWWITSALESNIGLNAIAQFTGNFNVTIPQGLGTGGLFETNFGSNLQINNGKLYFKD